MYGLLGSGNIWLKYNYLNIWNLKLQKKNYEKITFTIVQIKFLAMHITKQKFTKFLYIYGKKFTKYLHGTSLLNILMSFGIK